MEKPFLLFHGKHPAGSRGKYHRCRHVATGLGALRGKLSHKALPSRRCSGTRGAGRPSAETSRTTAVRELEDKAASGRITPSNSRGSRGGSQDGPWPRGLARRPPVGTCRGPSTSGVATAYPFHSEKGQMWAANDPAHHLQD